MPMHKKIPAVFGVLVVAGIIFFAASRNQKSHEGTVDAAGPPIAPLFVEVSDLKAAGFTNAAIQPAVGTRFNAIHMTYFRVAETVAAAHPEWAKNGSANLVAVDIMPLTYAPNFSSTMSVKDLSGRTSACLTRPGYYICVVGPDVTKTVALANELQRK